MRRTAVIIGTSETCRRLERQLVLLSVPPRVLGRIIAGGEPAGPPALGGIDRLERIVLGVRPDLALVTLPAAMAELVVRIRTRLRRLGVADRFMPTLEDQIEGVGPRTHWDVDLEALLDRPPRRIDDDALRRLIRGRRVLITGAGGSIGGELSRIVAGHGPEVLVMVERSENALFEIDRQIARRHPEVGRRALLHDVVDRKGTLVHFGEVRPDVVLHAAAHKHVPMMESHPAAAVDNNLFGTVSVADAAAATGVGRLVMISTDKAVNPSSIMGATKRLAELYVQHVGRRRGVACSMVRFGNVLGSSGSVVETWARQLAEGGPLTVTDPAMTRYFMTVGEAAALVLQAAALAPTGSESACPTTAGSESACPTTAESACPTTAGPTTAGSESACPTSACPTSAATAGATATSEAGGEVFLLDMGEPVRIVDLARRFVEQHGLVPRLPGEDLDRSGPAAVRIVFTGARPGEKLHEDLSFDTESMRPTPHHDINIWMLPPPAGRYIEDMTRALDPVQRPEDPVALSGLIRRLVPGMVEPVAARRGLLAS